MKILILNDADPWMMRKIDVRAWAAHGLWFSNPGDVIICIDHLPKHFIEHVASIKGFDPNLLDFHILPEGEFGRREFDGGALSNDDFIHSFCASVDISSVTSIEALWPTPSVARFADKIGLPHLIPGFRFIEACGYELANSKSSFRAIASAANIKIPRGFIARSMQEAIQHSSYISQYSEGIMVKRDHGGAGGANHLVYSDDWIGSPASSGAARSTALGELSLDYLSEWWLENWDWMSNNDSFPVIVEEFLHRSHTYFSEFFLSDSGISSPSVGEMVFESGSLAREISPAVLSTDLTNELQLQSLSLAERYYNLGYRGYLSADAIATSSDEVYFTEVNARYTGSTHQYSVMPSLVCNRQLIDRRSVVQVTVPPVDFHSLIVSLSNSGLLYCHDSGNGIVALTPNLGPLGSVGPIMVNSIGHSYDDAEQMLESCLSLDIF